MYTVHKSNSLSLMFWNAQGVKSKVEELEKFLKINSCDVVCICETFLKEKHKLSFTNYICLRKDRTTGRLGGLAILIKRPQNSMK